MPLTSDINVVAHAAQQRCIELFAATDGNHGRAVAFMARLLGLEANIYVPRVMDEQTKGSIQHEGATVHVMHGDYDDAVQNAMIAADAPQGVLVQDTAWPGYEETPARIVEGYSTMLTELDAQLHQQGLEADAVFCPVGVGSLAHAVSRHFKSASRRKIAKVVTVEPNTAACLNASLRSGKLEKIETGDTIMSGMNCGTVSYTAWPDLQKLVDVSVTVSDLEAHKATRYSEIMGVSAGPCGACGIAALRAVHQDHRNDVDRGENKVIVLLNTEGKRAYNVPQSHF
ncbi:MAG: hypothetical protein Q9162_000423 [Coniocarpon cinnabarinum]